MERWFRSLKSECLDRMIFFGRKSLENAVQEYVEHEHAERNHQGLGNEPSNLIRMLVLLLAESNAVNASVECSSTTTGELPELPGKRNKAIADAVTVHAYCG